MRRGRWSENLEVLRERSRLNVVRAATLKANGLEDIQIYRRCQPDGPWRRLLPGIIMLDKSQPTRDQMAVAALLYAGPASMITGLEACRRYGLRLGGLPVDDRIHLLNPMKTKMLSTDFVIIERTIRVSFAVMRNELPLAPLGRAAMDLARRIREVDPVAKIISESVQRGNCHPEALAWELDHGTRRGTALPRRLLREMADLASVPELYGKRLTERLAVPPSHYNVRVYGPDGEYIGMPDQWWDEVAMALEFDSVEYHYSKDDYAHSLERDARYAAAGITLLRILPTRVVNEPKAVLADVEAAYKAAAARPRPPVTLIRTAA